MSNFLQGGRRSGALMICLTGACFTSLPQAFVSEHGQFLVLRFALGLFIGGILPAANALVGRIVPSSQRGLSYGLTASALSWAASWARFPAGPLATLVSIPWVFALTALLFLLNLIWVCCVWCPALSKRSLAQT